MKKIIIFFLILFFGLDLYAINDKPILFVFGTRPEAIKVLPLYKKFKENNVYSVICSTGQHTDLLDEIFKIFDAKPDFDFHIMKPNQDLSYITEVVLEKMKDLIKEIKPILIIVQGDTTSAMAAALAGFYEKIPIAHIEAGLRTNKKYYPFPEEINRRIIDQISTFLFAPTTLSVSNLLNEGLDKNNVFCVGNTVVDALLEIDQKIEKKIIFPSQEILEFIENNRLNKNKIFLLTAHRRETVENGLNNIYEAANTILERYPNVSIIYPIHPNPKIHKIYENSTLKNRVNIKTTPPLSYIDMVYLLRNVDGVLTDSGGIQEEASVFGKPVIVLREETERIESLENKNAVIAGINKEKIIEETKRVILDESFYPYNNVYGDGTTCDQILKIIDLKMKDLQ